LTATAITNTIILPIAGTWRSALAYYGFFGVFVVFLWLLFAKDKPTEQSKSESSSSFREGIKVLLKERNIWLVAIIGFSSFYVRHSLGGWLPSILEFRGMTPEKSGILASIPSWVGLIGSIAIPRIGSIGTRKYVISTLLFVQGICTYILGTTIGLPLNIALILYGLCTYAILPLLMETMMGLPQVGVKFMGVAGGLFFSIGEIGGFLGPSMMGVFLDWTGSTFLGILTMTAIIELMIVVTMILKLE
jgi:cyanate permease